MTARASRVLEWRPPTRDRPPPRTQRITTAADLTTRLLRHPTTPLRVQYIYQDEKQFDAWCRLAFAWCAAGAAAGVLSVVIVDEAANVTRQGKADGWWGRVVREGKHVGCELYVLTQSPAEIDNTTRRNVNVWHTGRLATHADRMRFYRDAGMPLDQLEALKPLEYLEAFDHSPGFILSGRL